MPRKHFAIERVSVSTDGSEGIGGSSSPDISGDGRYVAFTSNAPDLVPDDDNNTDDVFVHDRRTNTTEIVSVNNAGDEGNLGGSVPSISDNGRFVAYYSRSSNLVPDDGNGTDADVFVYDRKTDTTEIISVASDGSAANDESFLPKISANGRYVVYESNASNLVPGDGNGATDVFLHDRHTGTTELVSASAAGGAGNGDSSQAFISSDGRFVTYSSLATDLVDGIDDNNNGFDVFVFDRKNGTTELVSTTPEGRVGNLDSVASGISANGRYVAFYSLASDLVPDDGNDVFDVFVHDRKLGTTERVSVASNGEEGELDSLFGSISDDGRYVTFSSAATNFAPGDGNNALDIFVHDRKKDTTTLLSRNLDGDVGDGESGVSAISANGRHVAFSSAASDLVPGDGNGFEDIFVASRFDWLV
ncbi:hypothetical protein BB934_26115 [Microvirga ossetica]|uniref:Calcium-binding protein n=1 Tax=Microvirga ossetica TaxID=1882682 RepID=A0A1B2EMT1_9HYPH|nr:hypothetical protein [Microvirga ossetica]ANY81261.1 hypothetical protein BB934_26115 [Microvirga ossetica]